MNLGVQGTWIQRRLDWDKLKFFDQIDPIYGFNDAGNNPNPTFETQPDNNTISFVDFSAGALFFSSKFFGGVAVKHLSTPQQSWYDDAESTLPIRITGHAGGVIEIGKGREKSKIAPSIMYTQQANFKQLNLGTYFDRNIFYGGFFFRHTFGNSDAVILVAGINKKVWGIGYSYDFTISPFAKETGGAHEISLQFKLGMNAVKDDKKRIKGTLKCPNILE